MLQIIKADKNENCRTLRHGPQVFHNALRAVLKGESRFHVRNDQGDDYDLLYFKNNDAAPNMAVLKGYTMLPPYYLYDETDKDALYLDVFSDYNGAVFEELNEYSVVLTKVILEFTKKKVWIPDERIYWFVEPHERLHVTANLPNREEDNVLRSGQQFSLGFNSADFRSISLIPLFNNVFFWQWLSDIPLSDVKYVEVALGMVAGIGAILAHYTRINNAFQNMGWKTVLKRDSTRYKDDMLERYFNLDVACEDSDETNTIYVTNTVPLVPTHFVAKCNADFDDSILSDSFIQELKEYEEAVIGSRRMLGILMRGTDYIVSKMTGARKMATVDEMLPLIHEWMEKDRYDAIFLATEDQDILDKMQEEFKGKIRVIAQERHRVSDFKDVALISDLERQEKSGQDYESALEDTTVNYFYALYMLSRCESFMCSGHCNGWDVVNAFNHNKFRKKYKFQVGIEEKNK